MKINYHSKTWKIYTEIILKKSNRPDYILFKTYRIISLENCLGKIIEKLMINQLSYWNQTTDLLNQSQIGGRKNYSILDEIIELVHEIQTVNQNKKIMFCLLLNIKRTFDYVNKKQLFNIMNMTKIFSTIAQMNKRLFFFIFFLFIQYSYGASGYDEINTF